MTYDEYDAFCSGLTATFRVIQWGGAHVWKVGTPDRNKVFAIGGWSKGAEPHITFKVSDIAFEMLQEQPGLRPAPYLASRGMKWIQHYDAPGLSDDDLRLYLAESHRIVASGLPKKLQREMGLIPT